ncbi:MAG: glutamate-5-semialdehyde dehydrogenase [Spirochaetes bacterium]|nr:glutamate-5-semialdehyde dehydrogenase [Spirochaetota bacterium]
MDNLKIFIAKAVEVKPILSVLSTKIKNEVLKEMGRRLVKYMDHLIKENKKDVELAQDNKLSPALIDRLVLNEKRIKGMSDACVSIAELDDPVGEIVWGVKRPNGLEIRKVRVPIGVIFVIYESRPNVTVDAASLCFKSGNVALLRGGSESFNSNMALVNILKDTLRAFSLPQNAIMFIPTTSREAVKQILKYNDSIDLVIPRGGENLIKMVTEESRIPVVYHAKGVCHVFVDESADRQMAENIVINAKTQRPGVCNAIETLLVHKKYKGTRELLTRLNKLKVQIRGDKNIKKIFPKARLAKTQDWSEEYLDLILSVKMVKDIDEAIEHIKKFGSAHSDAIVTKDFNNAQRFVSEVDSAAVYINASTRFTDGGEFGFGAEMGISTQKLHCRGPMGLEDLTTTKYIILGQGQIRE